MWWVAGADLIRNQEQSGSEILTIDLILCVAWNRAAGRKRESVGVW